MFTVIRLLPLGENVPVGAAVLHGDTVSTVWCVVADGIEGAILIIISNVLQHCCIPHKTKPAILHLKDIYKVVNNAQKGASEVMQNTSQSIQHLSY